MNSHWCRSCGAGQSTQASACAACGVALDGPPEDRSSCLGLVYAIPGRLRVTKRMGICTHLDGDTAHLHTSAKEKDSIAVPVASLSAPEDLVPVSLSPAMRLIYATRQALPASNAKWDSDLLLTRTNELARASVGAMRAVADEALELGWEDIVEWTTLTDSEKAWRRAHHAATAGDLDVVAEQLRVLPAEGYHARVGLLVPHLPSVSEHEACRAHIGRWRDAGLPNAMAVSRLLGDEWSDGMRAGLEVLSDRGTERHDLWSGAYQALIADAPRDPVVTDCPSWRAASLVVRGSAGESVGQDVSAVAQHLSIPLLDDLIESGGVEVDLDLSFAGEAARRYLLARLRPYELTDEEAAEVGHHTELARRQFLRADRNALRALPSTPGVEHYRALLDAFDGKPPDRTRLYTQVADLLELSARSASALTDGHASNLPAPVARDASLWRMFAEHARTGRLSPDHESRVTYPDLANWCDLQRMVGLLWDERWRDAIAFGEKLSGALDDEQQQDEALSLTAYAMLRTGRSEEAISLLEKAMAGNYTEALLINLSVAAAETRATVAATYFARIVDEAPTHELRLAALRRAVGVWSTADEKIDFPAELVGPLEVVLSGDLSVDDYARFASLAANVAPEVILRVAAPSGERGAIHRLHHARARFATESDFILPQLAKEIVDVHRQVGRPEWFNNEWSSITSAIIDSMAVDFGEALGSMMFVDEIVKAAPELFTQHQRFVLLPQAGAHLAAALAKDNDSLSDEAMTKFFFRPIEEFLAERTQVDSGMAEILADNFHNTVFAAGMYRLQASQNTAAEAYNDLVERLRWDTTNRLAILERMRAILAQVDRETEAGDRVVDRLQRLAVDTEQARERTAVITRAIADWRAETVRLRANL